MTLPNNMWEGPSLPGLVEALHQIADLTPYGRDGLGSPEEIVVATKAEIDRLRGQVESLRNEARMRFAGQAMQGFCANPNYHDRRFSGRCATDSVAHADALIDALTRKPAGGT